MKLFARRWLRLPYVLQGRGVGLGLGHALSFRIWVQTQHPKAAPPLGLNVLFLLSPSQRASGPPPEVGAAQASPPRQIP